MKIKNIYKILLTMLLLSLLVFSCNNSSGTDAPPIVSEPLRPLADSAGILLGAAANSSYLSEAGYSNTLATEFNAVVSENNMKFSYLEPQENTFTYTNADVLVDFAEANNMPMRGHVLLWHSDYQVPQWVKDKPYSEMQGVIENHIENVMTHYNGKIYAWDVANEIVKDDGSGLRNRAESNNYSVWSETDTDDAVIRAAFVKADEMRTTLGDNNVQLYLCDYSNETMGHPKADKFYEIVAGWVADGDVPIDGVAFQMHLMEDYDPNYDMIGANIDRFQALGLEVQFTEVDVRIQTPFTQAKLEHQAEIYRRLMELAIEKGVDDFIIWGVTDKYSWIPQTFSNYGSGLIFDESYNPKLSQVSLVNVLSQ